MIIEAIERKRRRIARERRIEDAAKIGTGLTLGATFGALIGILFAPKAGYETREDIANKGREVKEQVVRAATDMADKAQVRAGELKQEISSNLDDIKDRAQRVSEVLKEGGKEIQKDLEAAKDDIEATSSKVTQEIK